MPSSSPGSFATSSSRPSRSACRLHRDAVRHVDAFGITIAGWRSSGPGSSPYPSPWASCRLCVMWMRSAAMEPPIGRAGAVLDRGSSPCPVAMGAVSGIVLSYQFGTNWSRFSAVLGNVVGPMIGYGVLVAFFLEATFLGVMLFGWNRGAAMAAHAVGRRRRGRHDALGVLDTVGQQLDADAGRIRDARWRRLPARLARHRYPPSFPYRLAHMVTAAYLTTSFVVLAVGARYVLPAGIWSTAAPCSAWP